MLPNTHFFKTHKKVKPVISYACHFKLIMCNYTSIIKVIIKNTMSNNAQIKKLPDYDNYRNNFKVRSPCNLEPLETAPKVRHTTVNMNCMQIHCSFSHIIRIIELSLHHTRKEVNSCTLNYE